MKSWLNEQIEKYNIETFTPVQSKNKLNCNKKQKRKVTIIKVSRSKVKYFISLYLKLKMFFNWEVYRTPL